MRGTASNNYVISPLDHVHAGLFAWHCGSLNSPDCSNRLQDYRSKCDYFPGYSCHHLDQGVVGNGGMKYHTYKQSTVEHLKIPKLIEHVLTQDEKKPQKWTVVGMPCFRSSNAVDAIIRIGLSDTWGLLRLRCNTSPRARWTERDIDYDGKFLRVSEACNWWTSSYSSKGGSHDKEPQFVINSSKTTTLGLAAASQVSCCV